MKNWFPDKFEYFNFPVGKWRQYCGGGGEDNLKKFVCPLFRFLKERLQSGESVLLHCLAGAHRAGITGVLALMFFRQIPANEVCTSQK